MLKNYKNDNKRENQVMGNTSAHHPLTDGRTPLLDKSPPPPVYILGTAFCGVEYPW